VGDSNWFGKDLGLVIPDWWDYKNFQYEFQAKENRIRNLL